jgi:hypothetical protein
MSREGAKGRRKPAVARQRDNVGEIGGKGEVIQEKSGYKKIKKNSLPCFYKKRFFPASVVNKHFQQPKLQ